MDDDQKFLMAKSFYQQKQYDQAFDLYSELENKGYKNYEMFIELGHIYFHHMGLANAYQKYLKAHELDPSQTYPLIRMLKCQDQLNQPVEMFIEDYFDSLLQCQDFSEKEIKKIKLVFQKQGKENLFEKIESKAIKIFIQKKQQEMQSHEALYQKIDHMKLVYQQNTKNATNLMTLIDLLEKDNRNDEITEILDHAYYNINHFEVDYIYARHYIHIEWMTDAMTAINRMEERLKKHEKEHKMIKFYEYKKLAELYQMLGNEALYQFYDKKRIETENQTKPRRKKATNERN
ncbi:MAG: hypothetical protein V3569_05445 [Acholeplasmataceae bacterium]|nr:hypothetical protein [Acholeplasmataceae bacterium]